MPDFDDLPLDKFMEDTEAGDALEQAADDELPDEDTSEEEAGGEEPAETDDTEETEEEFEDTEDPEGEEPEEESETDSDSFLPKFDRKKIENHEDPNIRAAFKHMQAAFTKATMKAAEQRKEAEGLADQAREVLERYRAFVATLEDDKGAERFLTKLALERPEVFEAAYQRAAELNEDEDERRKFHREEEVEEKASRVERLERKELVERIHKATLKEAEAAGLTGGSARVAVRYVANKILENRAATGKANITMDQIREAVKAAAEDLGVVRKQVARERQKVQKKDIQKRVTRKKRPAPAGSKSPVRKGKLPDPPKGKDRLDHLVDSLLN